MNTRGKLTVPGANWLIFSVLILQFIVGTVVTMALIFMYGLKGMANPSETSLIYYLLIATQIFAVFIPTIIYIRFKRVPVKKTLGLRPLRSIHVALIVILGITGQFIAQILNIPIIFLLSLLGEIPPSPIPIPKTINELVLSLLIIGILPAIFEEILMRGAIMKAYEIRGTRAALLISALFFAIIHGDIKNLLGPIFFGLLFGYFVMRTGSLLAGMLAHFVNNSFAMILAYLIENFSEQFSVFEIGYGMIILYGLSIIIFIPAFILFNKTTDWEVKMPISTVKKDLKAAFVNAPIILTVIIYVLLQINMLLEIVSV